LRRIALFEGYAVHALKHKLKIEGLVNTDNNIDDNQSQKTVYSCVKRDCNFLNNGQSIVGTLLCKKYIDTKQSNKRNNQNSKDKRQDYNMK